MLPPSDTADLSNQPSSPSKIIFIPEPSGNGDLYYVEAGDIKARSRNVTLEI
jgi:hypothetical protein